MSKPQINVTPLIDVLLVLLIIFMVVTPLKPSAFEARIPSEPQPSGVSPDPRTIVVTINTDRSLRLNNEVLGSSVDDPSVLIERLSRIFHLRERNLEVADTARSDRPRIEKTVFIKAPRGTDYGSVARIVDAVKIAGANPVSLQIDGLD